MNNFCLRLRRIKKQESLAQEEHFVTKKDDDDGYFLPYC